MKILLIDTVGRPNLVAFADTLHETVTEEVWQADGDEAERVLPAIRGVLDGDRPDAIICVNGPGRFTSTRIGVAVANALSMAWQVPVTGIDRLAFSRRLVKDRGLKAIAVPSEKEGEYYFLADDEIRLAGSHDHFPAGCLLVDEEVFGRLWSERKGHFFATVSEGVASTVVEVPVAPFYVRAPNITVMKKL